MRAARWALLTVATLAGCAAPPRLATLGETFNEVSRGNQAQMEAQCGTSGQQSVDCKRKVREEFERLRRKNDPAARS